MITNNKPAEEDTEELVELVPTPLPKEKPPLPPPCPYMITNNKPAEGEADKLVELAPVPLPNENPPCEPLPVPILLPITNLQKGRQTNL